MQVKESSQDRVIKRLNQPKEKIELENSGLAEMAAERIRLMLDTPGKYKDLFTELFNYAKSDPQNIFAWRKGAVASEFKTNPFQDPNISPYSEDAEKVGGYLAAPMLKIVSKRDASSLSMLIREAAGEQGAFQSAVMRLSQFNNPPAIYKDIYKLMNDFIADKFSDYKGSDPLKDMGNAKIRRIFPSGIIDWPFDYKRPENPRRFSDFPEYKTITIEAAYLHKKDMPEMWGYILYTNYKAAQAFDGAFKVNGKVIVVNADNCLKEENIKLLNAARQAAMKVIVENDNKIENKIDKPVKNQEDPETPPRKVKIFAGTPSVLGEAGASVTFLDGNSGGDNWKMTTSGRVAPPEQQPLVPTSPNKPEVDAEADYAKRKTLTPTV